MTIALDPRLATESIVIGEGPAGWLLLRDEARWPWCLWVPRTERIEFHDLDQAQQLRTMQVVASLASAISSLPGVSKINIASLGNVVAQQHWHVIGRIPDDPAGPAPTFGLPRQPYPPDQLAQMTQRMRVALDVAALVEIKSL
jgi:diadenosine tetraphosphate (Ap4A) HIT family hydrolase